MPKKTHGQLLVEVLDFAMARRFQLSNRRAATARLRQQHVDVLLDLAGEIRTILDQRRAKAGRVVQ